MATTLCDAFTFPTANASPSRGIGVATPSIYAHVYPYRIWRRGGTPSRGPSVSLNRYAIPHLKHSMDLIRRTGTIDFNLVLQ